MMCTAMSIDEVLSDPLIRQVMQADRVSLSDMQALLQEVARKQREAQKPRHYN